MYISAQILLVCMCVLRCVLTCIIHWNRSVQPQPPCDAVFKQMSKTSTTQGNNVRAQLCAVTRVASCRSSTRLDRKYAAVRVSNQNLHNEPSMGTVDEDRGTRCFGNDAGSGLTSEAERHKPFGGTPDGAVDCCQRPQDTVARVSLNLWLT